LLFVLASYPLFLKIPVPNMFPKWEDLKFMAGALSKPLSFFRSEGLAAAEGTD
jgi:hypothetical protein